MYSDMARNETRNTEFHMSCSIICCEGPDTVTVRNSIFIDSYREFVSTMAFGT